MPVALRLAAAILLCSIPAIWCLDGGAVPDLSNASPAALPYFTNVFYDRFANLSESFAVHIGQHLGFCIKDSEKDWNGAFNFSSDLEFMSNCITDTNGDLPQRLCTAAEIKFYFNSFFINEGNNNFLRPNINCNTTSWASGCEPGWACSGVEDQNVQLNDSVNIPFRAQNCRPCCEGFFCPRGITCMIPCPLGAYCPSAKLNTTTGVCDPYNYQPPPGQTNHTCGGADRWADIESTSEIFCPAGYFCPSTIRRVSCSSGYYCRMGSISEKRCFRKNSCKPNSANQDITLFGALLMRMKTESVQQRRQELEEEVRKLQIMLRDEERVHEILQRALLPNCNPSALHIPNFLPKKAKELLAELIMLEEEIALLEGEISKIQRSISSTEESLVHDSEKRKGASLIASSYQPSTSPTQIRSDVFEEKVAFESKSMFFINQAIKGAFSSNHGFASNGGSLETASRKERQRMVSNQERIPKKSGLIEQHPSQRRPPRHPFPKQSDSNVDILQKLLHEPSLSTNPLDKNGQKWQPTKLSEKILKCLICIFLRLMRTSRAMELEKLNNISRSSSSISRSWSFRMESGLNSNSNPAIHRETVQKDPYGIFQMEDSLVRDIGPYKHLVMFTSSSLELKGISNCLPLLNKLRNLMSNLNEVNLKSLTHQQKLAFWINVHNICVMNGFLEHGLPSNPEIILGLRNKAVLNIGGNKLNALAIEHFILKQPSNGKEAQWKADKDAKEDAIRIKYGLEQAEPNVQFALCFGNRSSPAVKIYTSDGVSAELERSKLEYLQASIVVTASRRIMIPKLLVSTISDESLDLGSLLEWICSQLPTSGALRKSITECVRGLSNGNVSDAVDVLPSDFEFQYLLPM